MCVETSLGTRQFAWWDGRESVETATDFWFLIHSAGNSACQSDCLCHMTLISRMLITTGMCTNQYVISNEKENEKDDYIRQPFFKHLMAHYFNYIHRYVTW